MYDKKFEAVLSVLFPIEGGYSNRKSDPGGATNLGITHKTFDAWRKAHNRPTENIKNISRKEAKEIYYEWYWKASGADKQEDIRDALILFDTAVQYGHVEAKRMFKNSGYDFYKMLDIRRSRYNQRVDKRPDQEENLNGWLNRVNNLEKCADKLIKDSDFKPAYMDYVTPFDEGYEGTLRNVTDNDLSEKQTREQAKNKYLYELHKNGGFTGYATDLNSDYDNNYEYEDYDEAPHELSFREKLIRDREERLARYTQRLAENPEKLAEQEAKHTTLEELMAPQEARRQRIHDVMQGTVEFDENADYSAYENKKSKDNKIFTQEEIDEMTDEEREKHKEAIFYQKQTIGVPTKEQAEKTASKGGMVYVNSYTRKDGTQVKAYYRSR